MVVNDRGEHRRLYIPFREIHRIAPQINLTAHGVTKAFANTLVAATFTRTTDLNPQELNVRCCAYDIEKHAPQHLQELTDFFNTHPNSPLRVTFFGQPGAGDGPTRAYLCSLIRAIIHQLSPNSSALSELLTPGASDLQALSDEEETTFNEIGKLFMWSFLQKNMQIGARFHPAIFAAALSLTPNQLMDGLTPQTKEQIRQQVLDIQANLDPMSFQGHIRHLRTGNIDEIANGSLNEEERKILDIAATYYSNDDENVNLNTKENLLKVLRQLRDEDLSNDTGYCGSVLATQLSCNAILCIARGMREILTRTGGNWATFQTDILYEKFNSIVQGSLARDDVTTAIQITSSHDVSPQVVETVEWIKEWVQNPETPDRDIRAFIYWATGSDSVSQEGIRVVPYYSIGDEKTKNALFDVHTCSHQIGINVTALSSFSTKEDFLSFFEQTIHDNPTSFSTL
jgi:hypothetical protein